MFCEYQNTDFLKTQVFTGRQQIQNSQENTEGEQGEKVDATFSIHPTLSIPHWVHKSILCI